MNEKSANNGAGKGDKARNCFSNRFKENFDSGSVTRSRIQGVICAKENENFRLNQKAFLLMDANRIDNTQNYNNNINQIRAQFPK